MSFRVVGEERSRNACRGNCCNSHGAEGFSKASAAVLCPGSWPAIRRSLSQAHDVRGSFADCRFVRAGQPGRFRKAAFMKRTNCQLAFQRKEDDHEYI